MVSFVLSELHADKTLTWEFHVDESQTTHYDMLIGRDLLNKVGIDLLFSQRLISWDGATAPMKDPVAFKDKSLNELATETFALDHVEEDFIQRMMDQKYSPADLDKEVEKSQNLTKPERRQLLQLLQKYE